MIDPSSSLPVLLAALVLDRLLGDPRWLWDRIPHPVALIGRAIDRLDSTFNRSGLQAGQRRRRGALALAGLLVSGAAIGLGIQILANTAPLAPALEAVVVTVLLAQKSLVEHVSAVADGLEASGLEGGRAAVARIVGRDVSVLDEAGVSRAAIESAAENFSDGLVAPAFWYALLGLPGLLVFKIASTADSMIGHRTMRHEAFGWAAARLDDLLNLLPARISALLIVGGAALSGHNAPAAFAAALRDAPKHRSPNAGWPEAAAAGALGLALGGPRRYGDNAVNGAWLNPAGRQAAGAADIRAALRLIHTAWLLLAGLTGVGVFTALWIAR